MNETRANVRRAFCLQKCQLTSYPAVKLSCGAADHAFLSGYNDKAILGTYTHPLHSLRKKKKRVHIRERANGRGHGHTLQEHRKEGNNTFTILYRYEELIGKNRLEHMLEMDKRNQENI